MLITLLALLATMPGTADSHPDSRSRLGDSRVSLAAVAGFTLALLPIVLTPGASFTLATEQALVGSRRGPAQVILGAAGIYCHALLAALGLGALVMRSSQAYTVVRLLGGLYLIG